MYIKKMKVQIQRDQGIVLLPTIPKGPKNISGMLNPKVKAAAANKPGALADGYWIVLQEWSQCTLKCGGGKSYLQRMCVPPKSGGKPCVGDAVLNKDCNKQPCPGAIDATGKAANTVVQKINKPIVKIMPFSSKPQRYTKCVIKESDMMYTKQMGSKDSTNVNVPQNKDSVDTIQVPVGVIMNNRTLTVYAGEDFDTHLDSFNILSSNLISPKADAKGADAACFWVNSEDGRSAHLCPFGCASNTKVVDEWRYDFNLFKYQCNYGHKEQELNFNLQKKLEGKIASAKQGLMDEAQDDVKKRAQKSEEKKLATHVTKTNAVALQAIQKEINIEEMIKNEEVERERKEEQLMNQRIEGEKDKQKCLVKAIKEKQLENQYNIRQKDTEKAVTNIKKAAAQAVVKRRADLKKLDCHNEKETTKTLIALLLNYKLSEIQWLQIWVKLIKKDQLLFVKRSEMVLKMEMEEAWKKSKKENIIVLPVSLKITQCIKPAWILMTSVTYVVIMNLENSSKTIEKAVILYLVMLMLHQRLMMLKIPQEDGFGKIKLLIIKLLLMIFLLQENKGLIDF